MKRKYSFGKNARYYRQEKIGWAINILLLLACVALLAYYAYVGNACVSHFKALLHGKSVAISL